MARVSVRIGSLVGRDGQLCQVIALDADEVVVTDPTGRAIRVRVVDLLNPASGPALADDGTAEAGSGAGGGDPVGVLLAVDDADRKEALRRAGHVREVLTGYRSGTPDLAVEGEPRPEFAPGLPLMQRYRAKAAELGVSDRTIRAWVRDYQQCGEAGLVNLTASRHRPPLANVDPRWVDACHAVLNEQVGESNVTKRLTLRRIEGLLERQFGAGTVPVPRGGAAYRAVDELSRGRGSFGASAKSRRSIANRPTVSYGRLRASRPGEYVLLDTTRLDVFALEPVTLRWVQVELTIAMDLYTRCILGLRLSPVSTKSVDVASVLFEIVHPRALPAGWPAQAAWPYHGLPAAVVVDVDRAEGPLFSGPGLLPDSIVVDHGKVYVSEHVTSACARLGISIQPARPYTPTDKAAVERFFRTLREGLLEMLPGYKGPDVFSRGADVEDDAFFYLGELEAIIREWVGAVYHRRPHESLVDPRLPGLRMSPVQRYAHGVARAGRIEVPRDARLALQLLPLRWRTIQHYGVEIDGLRYSGPIVGKYADRTSGHKPRGNFYGSRKGGKWPFAVDPDDLSRIYFHDPDDGRWHTLVWEHAADLALPLSADALAYAKAVATSRDGVPDVTAALHDLLSAWNVGLVGNRTERRIALRLAAERAARHQPVEDAEETGADGLVSARSVLLAQQLDTPPVQAAPPEQDGGDDDSDDDSDDDLDTDGDVIELDDFYADALEMME
ncbi:helix-turn-helix domain-containing protein [Kribbella sp. NPDC050820]|uniref:helix-turn-helix domain-containing protein n=1 Tax=Kribbella sp. NPDC050820 TaxID=3155408 RepID=UPI0033D44CEC